MSKKLYRSTNIINTDIFGTNVIAILILVIIEATKKVSNEIPD